MKTKPSLTTKTTSILNLSYYPNWNLRKMNPSCYCSKMMKMQTMNCCLNPNYRWNSMLTSLKRMKTPNYCQTKTLTKSLSSIDCCYSTKNRSTNYSNPNWMKMNPKMMNCWHWTKTNSTGYCCLMKNRLTSYWTPMRHQSYLNSKRMSYCSTRTNSKTRCLTNC